MRDKLEPKEQLTKCIKLKEAAKKASDEEAKKAEVLCDELKVAARVREARQAVEKAIKDGNRRIPIYCEWAITDLSKLQTDWAKKTLADVKRSCNEDLPKRLVKDTSAALIQMRDSGDTKDGFAKCFDLKRLAKNIGEEHVKAVDELCKEVQVAGEAAVAQLEELGRVQ